MSEDTTKQSEEETTEPSRAHFSNSLFYPNNIVFVLIIPSARRAVRHLFSGNCETELTPCQSRRSAIGRYSTEHAADRHNLQMIGALLWRDADAKLAALLV